MTSDEKPDVNTMIDLTEGYEQTFEQDVEIEEPQLKQNVSSESKKQKAQSKLCSE